MLRRIASINTQKNYFFKETKEKISCFYSIIWEIFCTMGIA